MKLSVKSVALLALFTGGSIGIAWAIPGYHISGSAAAEKSVQQFAEDSLKFRAVVYQAQLDNNAWRLALASYKYLQLRPTDPQRECSFSEAYWSYRKSLWNLKETNGSNDVPVDASKTLNALDEAAVKATKSAVQNMPNSVAAHLNYGNYLQYFGLMGQAKNIQLMLNQYKQAASLRPDLGYTHYALAIGYMGSGKTDIEATNNIIAEFSRAVALDPRLTDSYFFIAAVYSWPSKNDLTVSRFYLDKYLRLYPSEINSARVAPLNKYLREHNANG